MAYENIKGILKMPWEYEFENEWTTNGFNLKKPIDRFFIYRATNKENQNGHVKELEETEEFCKKCFSEYGDIVDFDRCKLSIDLYEKLWGLGKRTGYYYPLENVDFGILFGGDTMNSVLMPLSELLKNLCQSENGGKYEEQRKYINDNGKEGKINYNSIMYPLKLYQKYNEEFVAEICKKDGGFEEYVRAYHTLGNFVLVPEGYNRFRGTNKILCDYWDLSLAHLQKNENGYLSPNHFTKYINYFFLWDYVKPDKNGGYEIDPIGMNELTDERNISNFFKTATALIKRRGIFMTAMLRLKTSKALIEICDSYFDDIQGEKFLSTVHEDGFKAASEKLKNLLLGNESEEAKQILSELSIIPSVVKEAK